jgi:membrane protein
MTGKPIKISDIFISTFRTISAYTKGVVKRFVQDDFLFLASGIAFNVILCIIPILLLLSSFVGIVLNSSEVALSNVHELLTKALPDQPHTSYLRALADKYVTNLIAYRRPMGIVGAVVLLYTSSSLFGAVRTALLRVYKMTNVSNIFINQLKDVILVFALSFLFVAVNTFNFFYTVVLQSLSIVLGPKAAFLLPFIPWFERTLTSLVLTGLLAFLAYRFVPFRASSNKSALISTATTTLLWFITSRLYAYYLVRYQPYDQLYGTYAFILATLIWIFISCIIFLVGAAIGGIYRDRAAQPKKT